MKIAKSLYDNDIGSSVTVFSPFGGLKCRVLHRYAGAFFSMLCHKRCFACVKVIHFDKAFPYERIMMHPTFVGAKARAEIPLFSFRKMVYY